MKKTAIVTGITGQDGAYLAAFLLEKGYHVIGARRRSSSSCCWRLEALSIKKDIKFVELDLTDYASIQNAIQRHKPAEIYNLAAQSFVGSSFDQPYFTTDVNGLGVCRVLEAIRNTDPGIKFYQASTSEMFGKVQAIPQDETTSFYPRSPYGVAKLFGHWITINYRESYNIFGCSGILFNHESPLRGEEFITRKITKALARIKYGLQDVLEIGNVAAKRDWGYAKDYVEGMYLMLQHSAPDDYILATGRTHSVKEFIDLAMRYADIDGEWIGEGVNEHVIDKKSGRTIIKINPSYFRPAEVDLLVGDPSKARKVLNWQPKVTFEKLIELMMQAEFKNIIPQI